MVPQRTPSTTQSRFTTPVARNPSKLAQALGTPPPQRQPTIKQALLASTPRSVNQGTVAQRLLAQTRPSPVAATSPTTPTPAQLRQHRLSGGEVEEMQTGEVEPKALTPSPDLGDEDKENRMVKVRRTVEQVQKRQVRIFLYLLTCY